MTSNEKFLLEMRDAAKDAGHIWPEYAACEVAIESGWGQSYLSKEANNLFGQKAPAQLQPGQRTIAIETTEIVHGVSERVMANWLMFSTAAECFAARMALLNRLPGYYYDALHAANGPDFVRQVSGSWLNVHAGSMAANQSNLFQFADGWFRWIEGRWSTNPARAKMVLETHDAHAQIFTNPSLTMENA